MVNPQAMRWDTEVIRLCLSMFIASHKSYAMLKDSQMLKLPSGRQLTIYKNKIKQKPGVIIEMFRWMGQTALNMNIEKHGYAGGLIHDEMKIQNDLVMTVKNGMPELVGFIDTSPETNIIYNKCEKEVGKRMATQVLQFMFVGSTGFRFPIAHYPTNTAKPLDYHIIIPELIYYHKLFGFSRVCDVRWRSRKSELCEITLSKRKRKDMQIYVQEHC